MLSACVTVFANEDGIKEALINAKNRIDVPESLGIFESSSHTSEGKTSYNFSWRDEGYNSMLNITCDRLGRIKDYYYHSSDMKPSSPVKKLPDISRADVLEYAVNFLKKAVPEAFADENDKLVLNEKNYRTNVYDSGVNYNFAFNRVKDGVIVKGNDVTINLTVIDENIFVTSLNTGFDYDAAFEEKGEEIKDFEEKYNAAFPLERIYERRQVIIPYMREKLDNEKKIDLVYRFKEGNIGFISAYTGEAVKPDNLGDNYLYNRAAAADQSMYAGDMQERVLTEAEITELKKIAGLKTAGDIENILRGIEEIKMDDSLKVNETRISKNDNGYVISLSLYNYDDKNNRNVSISADAGTGEILNLYNYWDNYSREELTEEQKENAKKAIIRFLEKYAAEKLTQCSEPVTNSSRNNYNMSYTRLVNNIPYVNNGIYVSYDGLAGILTSYSLNFDREGEFADPGAALNESEAYKKIIGAAPLQKMYVLSEGKYRLCYSIDYSGYLRIDAVSGELIKDSWQENPANTGNYTDIGGHWSEEAVRKLAEAGIALSGEQFMPDSAITQEDLLRLFAAGIYYTEYLYLDTETLYRYLDENYVLTKEERNETAPVTREEAFVYMIRMANLERIAKLSRIFKVDFADKDDLTPERIGYAAILSGLNVIAGDGGYLRAKDNLTRAEAATMLFNYLKN